MFAMVGLNILRSFLIFGQKTHRFVLVKIGRKRHDIIGILIACCVRNPLPPPSDRVRSISPSTLPSVPDETNISQSSRQLVFKKLQSLGLTKYVKHFPIVDEVVHSCFHVLYKHGHAYTNTQRLALKPWHSPEA